MTIGMSLGSLHNHSFSPDQFFLEKNQSILGFGGFSLLTMHFVEISCLCRHELASALHMMCIEGPHVQFLFDNVP